MKTTVLCQNGRFLEQSLTENAYLPSIMKTPSIRPIGAES
jgi:hypothetical protein